MVRSPSFQYNSQIIASACDDFSLFLQERWASALLFIAPAIRSHPAQHKISARWVAALRTAPVALPFWGLVTLIGGRARFLLVMV